MTARASSPHNRHRALLQLVAFCVSVLVAAAVLTRPLSARKEPFDESTLAAIRAGQPEFVMIGDSLLGYSIDRAVLEHAIGGKRVEILWYGGAASAAWFLYLKNFVGGAGIHPRRVFIFIHDDVLTDPEFRTTGKYAQSLQRLRHDNERLVRELTKERHRGSALRRLVALLFPADNNRAHYQQKIDAWMRRVVTQQRGAARQLERNINSMFDLPNMRRDQPGTVAQEPPASFEQTVSTSFLPHMIRIAREGGYGLTFVRPKKRPETDGQLAESAEMTEYYAALRHYLESNGCQLVDLTRDPAVTAEMFADSVHIGPWATTAFTQHFAELLAEQFR